MTRARYILFLFLFIPVLVLAQNEAPDQTADASLLVPATITFQTNPAGLTVIVDGTTHTTPYQTTWTQGSSHTINTASPQVRGADTQFVFSSWSDAGTQSHTVTGPKNARTYTANFTTQYYLTMNASPQAGGTVTPSSGWRTQGQLLSINATAGTGYSFGSWSGSGAGSYTGTTRSVQISMNGPIRETGNFVVTTQPVLSVQPADRPVSSSAGSTAFAVSNAGSGTMNWTASSNQSWATITSGGSGTNGGIVTIGYSANPSIADSRVATITVTATGATGSPQAVTVTQAPSSALPLIVDTTSMSDDFGGNALNTGLWTFANPRGDVVLSVANNVLTFAIPSGVEHQPWTSGNTAPRVMQNVDPLMNVNGWTVRFNSVPAGSDTSLPMEGMLFEQDSANYVRVDIFSDGNSVYGYAAGFSSDSVDAQVYISTTPIPVPGPPVWICVTRSGSSWRFYYSLDGQTVFTVGMFERLLTLRRVGIYAGNAGVSPQGFNCLVDYFQGALPAVPILNSPARGESNVARPVMFLWQPAAGGSAYRLQVATDSLFSATLIDSLVTETSCSVNSLPPAGQLYWWRVTAKNSIGWGPASDKRSFSTSTTAVRQDDALPDRFELEQSYPNPFNPLTVIKYTIAGVKEAGSGGQGSGVTNTKLIVYDMLGREVATLVSERKAAGHYEVSFDGSGLASGVYVYRLTAGSFAQARTMLLIK